MSKMIETVARTHTDSIFSKVELPQFEDTTESGMFKLRQKGIIKIENAMIFTVLCKLFGTVALNSGTFY